MSSFDISGATNVKTRSPANTRTCIYGSLSLFLSPFLFSSFLLFVPRSRAGRDSWRIKRAYHGGAVLAGKEINISSSRRRDVAG